MNFRYRIRKSARGFYVLIQVPTQPVTWGARSGGTLLASGLPSIAAAMRQIKLHATVPRD